MRIDGTIVSKRVPSWLDGQMVTTKDGHIIILMRNQPTPAWDYTPKRQWPTALLKYCWSLISPFPSPSSPRVFKAATVRPDMLELVKKAIKEQNPPQHAWDESGEKCVFCGDKDWMGGSCSGKPNYN